MSMKWEYLKIPVHWDENKQEFIVPDQLLKKNKVDGEANLLNALGVKGYELVGVLPIISSEKPKKEHYTVTYTSSYYLYLKRLKD